MGDIINQIEANRIILGISKRKLAAMCDITDQYYWLIVTGKAPGCSYTIIESLCKAVYIDISFTLSKAILTHVKHL